MRSPRCSPEAPVALLSLHSHGDRSFLDDRELALLSGSLRDEGIANDLVLAVLASESEGGGAAGGPADGSPGEEVERRLVEALMPYDPVVYERVWDPGLVARLRAALPEKTFVGLRGEHLLLDGAPADVFCDGEPASVLGPLVEWLRGRREAPPAEVLLRAAAPDGASGWVRPEGAIPSPRREARFAPNLHPVVVGSGALPAERTFSLVGNPGCPYQADARENPLYAGARIPPGTGLGCAFCTNGNDYRPRPAEETAARVLEQLRFVRASAPDRRLLVLQDQNPFAYLTRLVEECEAEGLSGFTLLLETRADWFLRGEARFDRALEVARRAGISIAPFLVGIENFSQPELDRFNKGTTAEANEAFLAALWSWKERYGDALDLSHAAFGFILLTPWTTMEDLATNYAAIRRTGFDRLRGSLLLSRVRLYPETALYHLAERDGLLAEDFASGRDDASRRYGYFPSRPWRHAHPDVAHFASLATELAERNGQRHVLRLFQALVEAFGSAGRSWPSVTAEDVWSRRQALVSRSEDGDAEVGMTPADETFRRRFAALVRPLPLDGAFAGGWRFGSLSTGTGRVDVELLAEGEPRLLVELALHGDGLAFRRSRHYDIRTPAREVTPGQREALSAVAAAVVRNDR